MPVSADAAEVPGSVPADASHTESPLPGGSAHRPAHPALPRRRDGAARRRACQLSVWRLRRGPGRQPYRDEPHESLIDTRNGDLQVVDLPSSYTFRSLARGPAGEALVLGTDGSLHVIEPESGELTASIPVVRPWEEPSDWQQPRPALTVLDGTAYVTEPARSMGHAVDLDAGQVRTSAQLDVVPNEIGLASAGVTDHDDHDH